MRGQAYPPLTVAPPGSSSQKESPVWRCAGYCPGSWTSRWPSASGDPGPRSSRARTPTCSGQAWAACRWRSAGRGRSRSRSTWAARGSSRYRVAPVVVCSPGGSGLPVPAVRPGQHRAARLAAGGQDATDRPVPPRPREGPGGRPDASRGGTVFGGAYRGARAWPGVVVPGPEATGPADLLRDELEAAAAHGFAGPGRMASDYAWMTPGHTRSG